MLDREPFLKAIFAAPDDDLPRLVFADYLDEHGDHAWAELIRLQCRYPGLPADGGQRMHFGEWSAVASERVTQLLAEVFSCERRPDLVARGFPSSDWLMTTADQLLDASEFRRVACERFPQWYGAARLKVIGGQILTPDPLVTILTSPVTEQVHELDLSGIEEMRDGGSGPADDSAPAEPSIGMDLSSYRLIDFDYRPVLTVRVVEALCQMRQARRLTVLDLRNNNLDNDALRALAKSPHLIRLQRLLLTSPGNRFRGRVWQQVVDRFGPDVVE